MKKLLAIVSVIALAGSVSASARVYEFSATVKTTVSANGRVKNPCVTDPNATILYRKQGSVKVAGLIWGCGCTSLVGPTTYTSPTLDGCLFWNISDHRQIASATNTWHLLHRIDSKGNKAEGLMEIAGDGWYMLCGGFGSINDIEGDQPVIRDMKGTFAGWRMAPTYTKVFKGVPCTFCASGVADVEEVVPAEAWALCSCAAPSEKTVVWGNWKLKYNARVSERLNTSTSILSVYTFPSYVATGN